MDNFADEIGVPREYFSDLPRQFNLDHIIYTLLSVNHPTVAKFVNIPEPSLKALILSAREIVVKEKSLLSLTAPIKICGDIHGQYYDLLRLFDMGGFPPESKYLFLGDYVDRGHFSIECIVLLLCYKVKYPDNIFLLRGNHECAPINRLYGFFDECFTRYSEHLWKLFIDLFNCLPISAVVEDKIFCTHGGLSPHLISLKHIRDIERPTEIPESGLLCDLLWADPSTEISKWGKNERGISCTFGEAAVTAFLDKFDFDLIVRAHQVVPDGYEVIMGQKLVTMFSAPNYCGEFDNAGAILCVDSQLMCSFNVIRPREKPMLVDHSSCVRRYPPGYSARLMMRLREQALSGLGAGVDPSLELLDGDDDRMEDDGGAEMQEPPSPEGDAARGDGDYNEDGRFPSSDESDSNSSDYSDTEVGLNQTTTNAYQSATSSSSSSSSSTSSTRPRQPLRKVTSPSTRTKSGTKPKRPGSPLSPGAGAAAGAGAAGAGGAGAGQPAGSAYAALMAQGGSALASKERPLRTTSPGASATRGKSGGSSSPGSALAGAAGTSPRPPSPTNRAGVQGLLGAGGAGKGAGAGALGRSPSPGAGAVASTSSLHSSSPYARTRGTSGEREAARTGPQTLSQRLSQIAAMKQGSSSGTAGAGTSAARGGTRY